MDQEEPHEGMNEEPSCFTICNCKEFHCIGSGISSSVLSLCYVLSVSLSVPCIV